MWANVTVQLRNLKVDLKNCWQFSQPAQWTGCGRGVDAEARTDPSTQLMEHSTACWVTPLPFSHGIAPIPALIFRSLRSCEKLRANRERKKIMVAQNSFLDKHKVEWNIFPLILFMVIFYIPVHFVFGVRVYVVAGVSSQWWTSFT